MISSAKNKFNHWFGWFQILDKTFILTLKYCFDINFNFNKDVMK